MLDPCEPALDDATVEPPSPASGGPPHATTARNHVTEITARRGPDTPASSPAETVGFPICYNSGVGEESEGVPESQARGEAVRAARAAPTGGQIDELLVDPPAGPRGGSIAGYRAGRWTRAAFAVVVLAVLGGGIGLYRWIRTQAEAKRHAPVIPSYATAQGDDLTTRPRQLVWSSGPARLGLSREPPGVEEIVLPDRRIRLADGSDHAQIKVEVVGDRTTSLKVLAGDIVQLPLEEARGSQPARPATGP